MVECSVLIPFPKEHLVDLSMAKRAIRERFKRIEQLGHVVGHMGRLVEVLVPLEVHEELVRPAVVFDTVVG